MIRGLPTANGDEAVRFSFPNGWTVSIIIGHDWLGHCVAYRGGMMVDDTRRDHFFGPQDAQAEEILEFLNQVSAKKD